MVRTCDSTQTQDPRAQEDLLIQGLQELLSDNPTLPATAQHCRHEQSATRIPWTHCAFKNCQWTSDRMEDLPDHIALHHQDVLFPLAERLKARELLKCAASEKRDDSALMQYEVCPVGRLQSGFELEVSACGAGSLHNYRSPMFGPVCGCPGREKRTDDSRLLPLCLPIRLRAVRTFRGQILSSVKAQRARGSHVLWSHSEFHRKSAGTQSLRGHLHTQRRGETVVCTRGRHAKGIAGLDMQIRVYRGSHRCHLLSRGQILQAQMPRGACLFRLLDPGLHVLP